MYIDKIRGIITDEQFISLSEQFQIEQQESEKQLKQHQNTISIIDSQQQSMQDNREIIHKLLSFSEITREMVNEMIDHIDIGGTRRNRIINIYWNF